MKKLIILFGAFCISLSAIAQQAFRIGNLEFSVRIQERDTTLQVSELDYSASQVSNNEAQARPKFKPYHRSTGFAGFGFVVPDNSNDFYTVLGGNSFNIDVGSMHKYYLARRFALGTSLQYSYYNYRLRNAAIEPFFNSEILRNLAISQNDIEREMFRSHNLALGVFARTYIVPPTHRGNKGLYFDIGAQGDWAFSRFYRLREESVKHRYRDNYAFNPFSASAIARIGLNTRKGSSSNPALFVRYRFTDAFNSSVLPMDLPPFTIGIQFF